MLGYRSDANGERSWVRLRLNMQPVVPLPPPLGPLKASGEHPDIVAHAHRQGRLLRSQNHSPTACQALACEAM